MYAIYLYIYISISISIYNIYIYIYIYIYILYTRFFNKPPGTPFETFKRFPNTAKLLIQNFDHFFFNINIK